MVPARHPEGASLPTNSVWEQPHPVGFVRRVNGNTRTRFPFGLGKRSRVTKSRHVARKMMLMSPFDDIDTDTLRPCYLRNPATALMKEVTDEGKNVLKVATPLRDYGICLENALLVYLSYRGSVNWIGNVSGEYRAVCWGKCWLRIGLDYSETRFTFDASIQIDWDIREYELEGWVHALCFING